MLFELRFTIKKMGPGPIFLFLFLRNNHGEHRDAQRSSPCFAVAAVVYLSKKAPVAVLSPAHPPGHAPGISPSSQTVCQ